MAKKEGIDYNEVLEMAKKEGIDYNLPSELICEIISWLPAKDLLRCKCVSKTWNDLINDRKFIKLHLDRSYSKTSFIAEYWATQNRYQMFSLHMDHHNDFTKLCSPIDSIEMANLRVVGSCDGLVCFQYITSSGSLIYNPTTRASKILPEINLSTYNDKKRFCIRSWVLGFGYDCVSRDYKVFSVTVLGPKSDAYVVSRLYSLKANTWEIVGDLPRSYMLKLIPSAFAFVYNSNSFNWLHPKGKHIMCFHLSTRMSYTLPLPEKIGTAPSKLLTVFQGKLCVVTSCFDIWIMEEYGNHESWAQLFHNTSSSLITVSDKWDLEYSRLACFKDSLNNFILSLVTRNAVPLPAPSAVRAPVCSNLWLWFYCDVQSQETREIQMPRFPRKLGLEWRLGAVLPWVGTLVPLH